MERLNWFLILPGGLQPFPFYMLNGFLDSDDEELKLFDDNRKAVIERNSNIEEDYEAFYAQLVIT